MAQEILLTKGQVAVVDDGDFLRLSKHSWYFTEQGYAACRMAGELVLMHRFLAGAVEGEVVDHEDGDTLNNQQDNLRRTSHSLNHANAEKRGGTTSQYKGVCRAGYNRKKPWRAYIDLEYKRRYLGYHTSEEAAAMAYDDAAVELFGKFAALNFPREGHRCIERKSSTTGKLVTTPSILMAS